MAQMPKSLAARAILVGNMSLLVLFPLAWTAPLMRAGVLPLFGLTEISILSGLSSLWRDGEVALALLVAAFALIAPMLKTVGLAMVHLRVASGAWMPVIQVAGKLAMADIFLIAVYITVAKGLVVGRVETAWGLWLFTACVLASLLMALATPHVYRTRSK